MKSSRGQIKRSSHSEGDGNVHGKTIWLINQYASTPDTGMGGRTYYMARALVEQGYRVCLISGSFNHKLRCPKVVSGLFDLEDKDGFVHLRVRVLRYRSSTSKARVLNWFIFLLFLRFMSERLLPRPEAIVYSSPALVGFLGAEALAKRFRVPLTFEVRDLWPLTLMQLGGYSPRHPMIRALQWIEDRAYQRADCVVSNLKNAIEHMAARGMRREKFTWIPNGYFMEEIEPEGVLPSNLEDTLPKSKFIVGYTGAIGIANALDSLIAAAEILRNDTDVAFVLIGGGRERAALEGRVKEKGLANVVFVDPIPKRYVQAVLARMDACYIGLRKEPIFRFGVSPNKLFDYLHGGRPVIYAIDSGDYHPVAEIRAGIEVEPENADAIAAAVARLKNMPREERAAMGANAKRAVSERHQYRDLSGQLAALALGGGR